MSAQKGELIVVVMVAILAVAFMLLWPVTPTGFAFGERSDRSSSGAPDLVVRQFEVWPGSPQQGRDAVITFTIYNRGGQTASSIDYDIDVGSASLVEISRFDTCDDETELAPRRSCRVARRVSWSDQGEQAVRITVDPDDVVVEGVEENNERTRRVRVRESSGVVSEEVVARETRDRERDTSFRLARERRQQLEREERQEREEEQHQEETGVVCTSEVKECPGGTYVERIPPSCEFKVCPPYTPPSDDLEDVVAVCGNGVREDGEVCDEGSDNGVCPIPCSASCTRNNCESSETQQDETTPDENPNDETPSQTNPIFCANENEYCTVSGTQTVRYGANGLYETKTVTGGVWCTNEEFGDPNYGVVKSCEIIQITGETQTNENEPSGFTTLVNRDWSCVYASNCDSHWSYNNGEAITIVQDSSAPRSPSSVAQMSYSTGFAGGVGPEIAEIGFNSQKTLYISTYIKLSSNWQGHTDTGINKLIYVGMESDGKPKLVLSVRGAENEPLTTGVAFQYLASPYEGYAGSTTYFSPNQDTSKKVVRGQWHHYEYLLTANTPGVANGRVQIWLDGVKTHDLSNIMFASSTEQGTFTSAKWSPVWGGVGGSVRNTMYQQMDHLYISGSTSNLGEDNQPPPTRVCGNGVREDTEQCDSGVHRGTCPSMCSITCTLNNCAPPSSGDFATHVPSGMALWFDTDMDNLDSRPEYRSPDGLRWYRYGNDNQKQTDTSTPYSDGVHVVTYPGNDYGNGGGVGSLVREEGNWRRMYVTTLVKLEGSNGQPYKIHYNEEKWLFPVLIDANGNPDNSGPDFAWILDGSGNWVTHMQNGIGSPRLTQNYAVYPINDGRWNKIEHYIQMNTPGNNDGVWRMWVNGQLSAEYTNVRYSNNPTQAGMKGLRFITVRGGDTDNAPTPPNGQFRKMDRLAVYVSELVN